MHNISMDYTIGVSVKNSKTSYKLYDEVWPNIADGNANVIVNSIDIFIRMSHLFCVFLLV
jgi:hypothetical protein